VSQDLLAPAWRKLGAGCCLNRPSLSLIEAAGFVAPSLPVPAKVLAAQVPAGAQVLELSQAIGAGVPEVERHLGRLLQDGLSRLHGLHLATFAGGVFCKVERGVELREPLQLTIELEGGSLFAPHLLVILEDGARADLIVEIRGENGSEAAVRGAVEIVLGDGAALTYTELQRLPGRVQYHWPRRAELGRQSSLHWILAEIGGRLGVADTRTVLRGEGAEARVLATFFGGRRQHFDLTHVMVHEGPHTTSDIEARGVLQGKARAVYNANSIIRKSAKGASGWQHEHTLMLSEEARADLIPELEISEWEVSAGHAASAGPVDPLQVYYLESRGVSPVQARRLIVAGFLASLLRDIPLAPVRDRIADIFQEKVEL
jgi:Fe-S cluster assembly protein SufD